MKILLVHNFYQQPGGEDAVFADEARLLESSGHQVVRFTRHNDAIRGMGRLEMAGATFWNRRIDRELHSLIRAEKPDIAHFHNTFPLISPAGYAAARRGGCAVVQTLHNYRFLCPNALLFRDGRPCEACLGKRLAWPGIVHACYRGSQSATAVAALATAAHRVLGTYRNAVDVFIAPTDFARRKVVRGGLPAEKVVVKPNFVDPDPGPGAGEGGHALFVGRLAPGKGVETLLSAWERSSLRVPLQIIGDGELAPLVAEAAARDPRIVWLGRRPSVEVYERLGAASLLIFPSENYETFGRVVVEAFAKGTPVLATSHGAAAEIVEPGFTGGLFRAGDPADLAQNVDLLLADSDDLARMRRQARLEYESKYTGRVNAERLTAIYRDALASSATVRHQTSISGQPCLAGARS